MEDVRTTIRKLDNQNDLWETALNAVDTALKEASLGGLLHPAAPEVDTLKTFFRRMRARYAAERAVLVQARDVLPGEAYINPRKGTQPKDRLKARPFRG